MAAYNIYEAKTKFSALVEKAENGEEVVISRAGRPVAKLLPFEDRSASTKKQHRKAGRNFAGWDTVPDSLDDPLPEEMKKALGMIE